MMERPKRWEQPDDIELTTLGEVRRLRWRCRRSTPSDGCEWWDPSNWGPEHPDSLPVFARNPNPPKPLEAGQVREQPDGLRWYLIGPDPDDESGWWVKLIGGSGSPVFATAEWVASLPVVEQEPREQKPRRMKANTGMGGTVHGDEHDESSACRSTVFRHCVPLEREGQE